MSAQQLAERCAGLGLPEITRPVLVKLEHGRREAVSTTELAVLAAALETAPILLLYPVGSTGSVEYLPGKTAPPWDAARWWADEASLAPDLAIGPAYRRSAGSLFRDHQQLLSELPPTRPEATIWQRLPASTAGPSPLSSGCWSSLSGRFAISASASATWALIRPSYHPG